MDLSLERFTSVSAEENFIIYSEIFLAFPFSIIIIIIITYYKS